VALAAGVIVYPSTWETLLGEGVLRGPGTLWGMQCVHVGNAAETFLMGEKAIQELCDPRWASEEESRRVMQLGIHEGTYRGYANLPPPLIPNFAARAD
jgi:hypothetical protein